MLWGIPARKHDRNWPTYSLRQPNSTFVCLTLLNLQHIRISSYPLLRLVTPVLKCMQDLRNYYLDRLVSGTNIDGARCRSIS